MPGFFDTQSVVNFPRIRETFWLLSDHALWMIPELPSRRIQICKLADTDHKKTWRVFAHTLHEEGTICFAAAAEEELTQEELAGIMAHEFGHLIAAHLKWPGHNPSTPKWIQDKADQAVREILKLPLKYNNRKIQELSSPTILALIVSKAEDR